MNKKLITLIGGVCLCMAIAITVFASQAGSSEDPLVTKSYVDDKISQVLQVLNDSSAQNSSLSAISQAEKDQLKNEILTELKNQNYATENDGLVNENKNAYVPVYAEVGQVVMGGEGTEIILRSGKADVYITGVAGIVNATTGKELVNGDKAVLNNIMIIPRNDGRGFKVTERAWFLIKGEYEIK